MVVYRQGLHPESFSTLQPSLGHPAPSRLACRIARELGHLLAIGSVAQEFLGWIHRLFPPGLWITFVSDGCLFGGIRLSRRGGAAKLRAA
jgi:hypothetical protein